MTISEYFKLNKTQYELDFIDIETEKDIPLFLDPYYLGLCNFSWAVDANRTLESFFSLLLFICNQARSMMRRRSFFI